MSDKKFLILIDGPMGSGKTTTSKLLHQRLPGTARVALADVKRFISEYDTNKAFSSISRTVVRTLVDTYLAENVSVIAEYIVSDKEISDFENIAASHNAVFISIKLSAPKDLLIERVQRRTREMMDVDVLPEEKIAELDTLFERNYTFHQKNTNNNALTIDTQVLSPEEVVKRILEEM